MTWELFRPEDGGRKWDRAGDSRAWSAGREAQEEEEQMHVTSPSPLSGQDLSYSSVWGFSDR